MKTCVICEQPGHRYGSTDPYHESVASACINSLKRRVAELEAERDRLIEALKKHGCHLATCSAVFATPGCTCGLEKALNKADTDA